MKVLTIAASVLISVSAFCPVAEAQSAVDSNDIVNSLQQKNRPLTRSLGAQPQPPAMSGSDRELVESLRGKTRGIRFDQRKQLATIVKTYDLASIDLEIYFDYDSDKISARARPDLVELGKALRSDALKGVVFLVSGHTDAAGGEDYNLELSDRRASSVSGFLTSTFGIDPSRLIAVGYGEEQLKNASDPEAAENRRVTIVNMSK